MLNEALFCKALPLLFVLSAPAGTGKTTLIHKMLDACGEKICKTISCTTRAKRPGEVDGKDYYFLEKRQFEKLEKEGAFIEVVRLFGHAYGTLGKEIERIHTTLKHAFLVIDTQGALKLQEHMDVVLIFLLPPSMEELKKRLYFRQSECAGGQAKRLNLAKKELVCAKHYDYHIVNDDLDSALLALKSIVIAEEHKNRRGKVSARRVTD